MAASKLIIFEGLSEEYADMSGCGSDYIHSHKIQIIFFFLLKNAAKWQLFFHPVGMLGKGTINSTFIFFVLLHEKKSIRGN